MMKLTVDPHYIYIVKNNITYKYNKFEINKILDNKELLGNLSGNDLIQIFKALYGIPSNYLEFFIKKVEIHYEQCKKFIYQSNKFWIDKETRNSLFNLLNSLDSNSEFELIVGEEIVKLSVSKVKDFLTQLEQYASACKVQTLKHINAIKDIKNVEDLLKYDYTLGYPKQINLNDFI